jgi:antitoxin ParD1/3/4
MSITLKPEQERLIQKQVELGRFNSAEEVLEKALQLLHEQYDDDYLNWIEDVRLKVDEAKAEAEQGDVLPLDAVVNRLQDKFREAREAQG